MTGYSDANFANDDWLISPSIDLTNATSAILTFMHAHRYGVNVESNLTLLVSTNFALGQFDTTAWTAIPFAYSDGETFTFVSSGELSLNDYLVSPAKNPFFCNLSQSMC